MQDASARPPAVPDDEFDGHGRYLDGFEPVSRDLGLWGSPWRAFDSLLALCLLGGVTAAIFEASPCGDGCDGPGGLVFLIAGFFAGALAGGVFLGLTRHAEHAWKRRAVLDLVAVLWISNEVLLPAREATRAAASQRRDDNLAYVTTASSPAQAEWLEALRRDGLHGAPGELPPGVAVVEQPDGVDVVNETEVPLVVGLARVLPDAAGPAGWSGCPLYGRVDAVTRSSRVTLEPAASVRFEADERCAATHATAAFEWRIGAQAGDRGWWSDSALAVPLGWSLWLDLHAR